MNCNNVGHLPIWPLQWINISSCHMMKYICFFILIFHWASSHLPISTNQCLFMFHEEMHLPLHFMGKCIGNFLFATLSILSSFVFFTSISLTFGANDISISTWANKIFSKLIFFENTCF